MPILHMETALVRNVGGQIQEVSVSIGQQSQQVSHLVQVLSYEWQGPSADIFANEIQPILQRLNQTALEGDKLNQRLQREVDEWERVGSYFGTHVSSSSGVITLPGGSSTNTKGEVGYLKPENIGSTDPKRIEDFKNIMSQTKHGRELLKWLDEYGVSIKFGDSSGIAHCTPNGKHIVINKNYANLTDYELAAVLVHESQHSKNSHPVDVPIIGPIFNAWYNVQDDVMYAAYPFPEEYRAFRAQAEFWREIGQGQPPSRILDDVVDLIFKSDGSYRDTDAVYRDLHNNYRYAGWFNP